MPEVMLAAAKSCLRHNGRRHLTLAERGLGQSFGIQRHPETIMPKNRAVRLRGLGEVIR